jgi:hypothetical protein
MTPVSRARRVCRCELSRGGRRFGEPEITRRLADTMSETQCAQVGHRIRDVVESKPRDAPQRRALVMLRVVVADRQADPYSRFRRALQIGSCR